MAKEKGCKKGKGKKKWKFPTSNQSNDHAEQTDDSSRLSAQERRDLKFKAKAMMQAAG